MVRLALFIIFSFLWGVFSVWALDFSGDWRYWEASDTENRLTQMYSLSFSSQATRAISFGSTLRYTRTDQGSHRQELFTPTAFLGLRNDYFNLNFSATDTERRDSETPNMSTRSWDLNLNSSYYKKVGNVRLYYGSSTQQDDSSPRKIDTSANHWGLSLDKEWYGVNIFYDYRGSHSEDRVENSKSDTGSHFIKGEYTNSWHKLTYNLAQQVSYSTTKWQGELQGGKALYKISVSVEWQPSVPTNGKDFNDWIDQVKNATPDQNLGIIIDLNGEAIDKIEFYYDSDPLSPKAIPSDVKWDIYSSNNKINWTQIANDVSLPYVFSSTLSVRYLKLIPRNTSATDPLEVNNPEFRVYRYLSGPTYKRKVKAYRTDLSFIYDFTENISLSYYFSYDKTSPDYGSGMKDIVHTVAASWWVNKYFQPRLNFTRSTSETEGQPETTVNTLSTTVISEIYETLTVSSSYTHSLSQEGGENQARSDNLTISTTARLYPDLDLRWDVTGSKTHNYQTNSDTKGLSSRINIIARIKPTLTINSIYDYNRTESSTGTTNTENYVMLDANWRLSDYMLLRGTESIRWSGGEKLLNSTYSVWLGLTPKVQLNFQYSGSRNSNTTDQFSSFFSWRISQYLSFKSTYSWTKDKSGKKWSLMLNLTLTF